jgi:hypothetical protein
MVRIIYHTSTHGYRVQDRETHQEIIALEDSFEKTNITVVCIIDFSNKIVSNKSSDFSEHMDRIDPVLFDSSYIQL